MISSSPGPRRGGVIFALVLISAAYFYQAGGWNQNSRYDLSRALAETGSVSIDAYHRNTGDKARFGGRFYSDKAPGQSLLAVPVVAITAQLADLDQPGGTRVASYLATVFTSGVPLAFIALALWTLARGAERSPVAAALCALGGCLATPLWAYGTLFMGHALAASALILAAASAHALKRGGRSLALGLAVGGGAGWAVLTEYTAALPAAMIAGYALWSARASRRHLGIASAGMVAAGGLCAVLLLGYHWLAFGSPFETPLGHLYLFQEVRDQPFHAPSGRALAQILLGAKRGLLPLAPLLIASVAGVVVMIRRPADRALGILCAAIVVYYLVLNASFATPLAGWSYGPRYLAAALPFWALPLAWAVDAFPQRWVRVLIAALALWGVAASLVAVSTTPQPPEIYERPMVQLLWPAFSEGNLALGHQSFLEAGADARGLRAHHGEREAFNLGQRIGLPGLWSLLPLGLVWALAGWALLRRRTRGLGLGHHGGRVWRWLRAALRR